MPVVVNKSQKVWWQVELKQPDTTGQNRYVKATAKYLWELASAETIVKAKTEEEVNADIIEELKSKIHDWDFVDQDQENIPCTRENIDDLFSLLWIRIDTVKAWLDCSMGGAKKRT